MLNKFYISGGSRFSEERVLMAYGFAQVSTMEDCDFVVFTGGADINPAIYGDEVHHSTYFHDDRDRREIADYHKAVSLKKAFLGICRGAQLLNCLVGGKLYQDIGHPGQHMVRTDEGELFLSNSVHHQMLRVGEGAIIKAWAENLSEYHICMVDGVEVDVPDVEQEPEIVIYPQHRMVLVQGHPEFGHTSPSLHRFRSYVFNLIKEA